jgi:HD-like signal output (HDOD) protein
MVDVRMTTLEQSAASWSAEADLDGAILDLVERAAVEVPPFPAIAARVERLVSAGDFAARDLERLVSVDPALAGAALRAANARRRGAVTSIDGAARRLGPHGLARAALDAIREAGPASRGPLAPLRRRAWRDAVSAAQLCRDLARARGLDPAQAYAGGLLHDAGRLLAIALLERIARGARSERAMPARWWEAVVERYHVRLGIAIAERWRLPAALRDAMALHHSSRTDPFASPDLVSAVSTCDAVVRVLADEGRVDEEDAASIRALTQEDADALARTVDRLPRLLEGLEHDAEGGIEPAARSRFPRVRPAGVRLRIANGTFEAIGFAPNQIVARGDVPLPEELLLEVEVVREQPFAFHARVLLCWPEDGRFGVVLMPFALSGPALLHWHGLVGRGRPS